METTVTSFAQMVAGNLRAEMARRKITIDELASVLKCSRPTARSRFNGETQIGLAELEVLAEWLDMDYHELLKREASQ